MSKLGQLTEKETEQRKVLEERLKGRDRPPIDPADIGIPMLDEAA